jgi:hypothetical protein
MAANEVFLEYDTETYDRAASRLCKGVVASFKACVHITTGLGCHA